MDCETLAFVTERRTTNSAYILNSVISFHNGSYEVQASLVEAESELAAKVAKLSELESKYPNATYSIKSGLVDGLPIDRHHYIAVNVKNRRVGWVTGMIWNAFVAGVLSESALVYLAAKQPDLPLGLKEDPN